MGLINSLLDPSLTRAPNQLACDGMEALQFISLLVKSIFLSISQSSTKIKSVKLFTPALTDAQKKIKIGKIIIFFNTLEELIT